MEKIEESLKVTLTDGTEIETDVCIMATGRKPNVEMLNLDKTDLKLNKDGSIWVDEF